MATADLDAWLLDTFERCKNWGRWGDEDELGTLNYITPEHRVHAASLVQSGISLSLSRPLDTERTKVNIRPMEHHMVRSLGDYSTGDYVGIMCHGFAFTHLDALSHCNFEGVLYNGKPLDGNVTYSGVKFGSIMAQKHGIFTRGVYLDIAAARGVEWLDPDDGITVADLERAEELAGVTVGTGDALIVRMGLAQHEAALGHPLDIPPRCGMMPETIPWLHAREVALFGGDCVDQLMSGTERMPMPLHQIGIVSMGLMLLDWPEVEPLAALCREQGRNEFLFTTAGLLIPGGTGSVVNPIATF